MSTEHRKAEELAKGPETGDSGVRLPTSGWPP